MKYKKLLIDQKKRNLYQEITRRRNKVFYQKMLLNHNFPYSGKNRCLITGAGKSPVFLFRLSRHTFRQFANNGMLPGIKPSSW